MTKYILEYKDANLYLETTSEELVEVALMGHICEDCVDEAYYNFSFFPDSSILDHYIKTDCGVNFTLTKEEI